MEGGWATHAFEVPTKKVADKADVDVFQRSDAYRVLVQWLETLNAVALRRSGASALRDEAERGGGPGGPVARLRTLLRRLHELLDAVPPAEGSMRFGNKAFRTWHQKLVEEAPAILAPALFGGEAAEAWHAAAVAEVSPYFLDSFGNPTRIDYGTGHELHFVLFLYCLFALGVLRQEHLPAVVGVVFKEYLDVARRVQVQYGLEPAGSRGVWCLDDYQFLPFYWGAAQLVGQADWLPSAVLNESVMRDLKDEYLYFGCIHYIYSHKRGPFFEHSPDLYNISSVPAWEKINRGMLLKYKDDVLAKWPVVQHVFFGSLFKFDLKK